MNCEQFVDLLEDLSRTKSDDSGQSDEFRQHFHECPTCFKRYVEHLRLLNCLEDALLEKRRESKKLEAVSIKYDGISAEPVVRPDNIEAPITRPTTITVAYLDREEWVRLNAPPSGLLHQHC